MRRGLPSHEEMERVVKEGMGPPPPKVVMPVRASYVSDCNNNPMSPYVVPHTRSQPYEDVVDVIRHKAFKAYYPESYAPVHQYYLENNITPPYVPIDGSDYAAGSITIDGMIDLVLNDQPWALERSEDIETILTILDEYIRVMTPYDNDKKVRISLQNVGKLRNILEAGKRRAMKRRGKITGMTLSIFDILKRLKG